MIVDYQASLAVYGAPFYRDLFWEAGLVGQMLYLEAEEAGIRSTGIGCYFDDSVHDVFGISSRDWQSFYHFTVGGPVEDSRLTTLPAYKIETNRSEQTLRIDNATPGVIAQCLSRPAKSRWSQWVDATLAQNLVTGVSRATFGLGL
jgi:hypothetical protein